MTGFWNQAFTITRRDLLRERRSGEVMWVTLPFGAIALLLVPLAIGGSPVDWPAHRYGLRDHRMPDAAPLRLHRDSTL